MKRVASRRSAKKILYYQGYGSHWQQKLPPAPTSCTHRNLLLDNTSLPNVNFFNHFGCMHCVRMRAPISSSKRHLSILSTSSRFLSTVSEGGKDPEGTAIPRTESQLHDRILQLCDDTAIAYGEYTPELWDESLELLDEMARLQTPTGLEDCCMLMDRLVIEQDHQQSSLEPRASASSENVHFQVTTDALNSIIRNWSKCWEAKQIQDLKPQQMLDFVDDWVARLDTALHPDVKSYGMILKAAANSHTDYNATRSFAESLFHRMQNEADNGKHPNVRPDTRTYASLIHLLSRLKEVTQAEFYFNQMVMEYARGNTEAQPNRTVCNSILTAYASIAGQNVKHLNIPIRAEKMLRYMQHLHESRTLKDIKPDSLSYQQVIKCWGLSSHPEAANKARHLYDEMMRSKDPKLRPTPYILARVLECMSWRGDASSAQALLDQHLQRASVVKANAECFKFVMIAWRNSGNVRSVEMIEKLIRSSQELLSEEHLKHCQSRPDHYNELVSCLAKHQREIPDAAEKAEAIQQEVETNDVRMGNFFFNCLIDIHARSGKDPYRAEQVLEQLYQRHIDDGKSDRTKPCARSFNSVLQAWALNSNAQAAKRADAILRRMWSLSETQDLASVRPDRYSYASVILCHSKSGNFLRCLELLHDMKNRDVSRDLFVYKVCLHALSHAGKATEAEDLFENLMKDYNLGNNNLKPDVDIFDSLLMAWAHSNNKNAGEKAQTVIDRMVEFVELGLLAEGPSVKSYTNLVKCWEVSGHAWASEKVSSILNDLESKAKCGNSNMVPDIRLYNAVLAVYANNGHATRAQDLLDRLPAECKPNLKTFQSVLIAWSKTSDPDPEKAETILKEMMEVNAATNSGISHHDLAKEISRLLTVYVRHSQRRGVGIRQTEKILRGYIDLADEGHFNLVLEAYASLGNARPAVDLLRWMQELGNQGREHLLPSRKTYNLVIKAFCESDEDDKYEASEILMREMYSLAESGGYSKEPIKPSTLTFNMLMKCAIKSNHPRTIERVETLRDELIDRQNKGEDSVEYDYIAFCTVMNAYCKHGDPEQAEAMLNELCAEALQNRSSSKGKLQIQGFLVVMRAWLRVDNPERAEAILQRICHYRDLKMPNISTMPDTYLSVVACWNRSTDTRAGERTDNILKQMEMDHDDLRIYEVGMIKDFYLQAMENLARVGDGERAEAMLRRVHDRYSTNENANSPLDFFLYREVINAWRQSQDQKSEEHIKRLEDEMESTFPNQPKGKTAARP